MTITFGKSKFFEMLIRDEHSIICSVNFNSRRILTKKQKKIIKNALKKAALKLNKTKPEHDRPPQN